MPNWVENDLYFQGKEVKKILAFIANKEKETVFDFDKVIPYPEPYRSMDERVENFRDELVSAGDDPVSRQIIVKKYGATSDDYFGGLKDGFNSGGYEWCIENWGTKWNAKEAWIIVQSKDEVQLTFDTAWSPPLPIIKRLSELFPEHTFVLNYYEGLMGFQGTYEVINGQVMEDSSSDYQGTRGG